MSSVLKFTLFAILLTLYVYDTCAQGFRKLEPVGGSKAWLEGRTNVNRYYCTVDSILLEAVPEGKIRDIHNWNYFMVTGTLEIGGVTNEVTFPVMGKHLPEHRFRVQGSIRSICSIMKFSLLPGCKGSSGQIRN